MRKNSARFWIIHLCAFMVVAFCFVKFPEEIAEWKLQVYAFRGGEVSSEIPIEATEAETTAAETVGTERSVSERLAVFSDYPPMEHSGEEWYQNTRLIYHAGGGIDGLTYTNSKEAMELCIKKGNTVIEVDFSFTSDGTLVCVHDWAELSESGSIYTLEEFRKLKIYGKYSPVTGEELIQYMKQNPQLYIVVDTKGNNVDVIRSLVELCNQDQHVIDRFIIQLYGDGEKQTIKEVYPFKDENFLFTLYKFNPYRYEEIMQVYYEENIRVITVGILAWEQAVVDEFLEKGFVIYEHTLNRVDDAKKSMDKGIQGVYTDFLTEEDMDAITVS